MRIYIPHENRYKWTSNPLLQDSPALLLTYRAGGGRWGAGVGLPSSPLMQGGGWWAIETLKHLFPQYNYTINNKFTFIHLQKFERKSNHDTFPGIVGPKNKLSKIIQGDSPALLLTCRKGGEGWAPLYTSLVSG